MPPTAARPEPRPPEAPSRVQAPGSGARGGLEWSSTRIAGRPGRAAALFVLVALLALPAGAAPRAGLVPVGAVAQASHETDGMSFRCEDGSRLRLQVLAPDLVRARLAFGRDFEPGQSWAVVDRNWPPTHYETGETPDGWTLRTSRLEVVVRRSPLRVEYRDPETGALLDGDVRPPRYDKTAGAWEVYRHLRLDQHFYGLGEKAAPLDKRRGQFTMWTADTPGYKLGTDPIYQSIPFYVSVTQGRAHGVFLDSGFKSCFELGFDSQVETLMRAEGGEADTYFFAGPDVKGILTRYSELTGTMPMPPRWALGHQQSRWSYYPDRLVEEVAREYRERKLPLDAIHLDIHFMQGHRVFTWDRERFPDPSGLADRLRRLGVRLVTIVDPGVKLQERSPVPPGASPELQDSSQGYYVLEEGLAKGYFLHRASGGLWVPKVWPGESVMVDFTMPEARQWWGDLHQAYLDHGVAGIWNDMNEPADFVDGTGESHADVVFQDQGRRTRMPRNRNLFGLLMCRATFEGLLRLRPDRRPFVLTRSGFAGIQRYAIMWTGDTNSTWEDLALAIPMYLGLGLSGQPFVGGDVGGFLGRPDAELMVRSYQLAFLVPFCRNHKDISGYDQEPWRFGKPAEDIIRRYLELRYSFLPYLYSTVEEAHRTGVPVLRPLLLEFPEDETTLNLDDQLMVGPALLLAPVLRPGVEFRRVYLPAGLWYDFWTGKTHPGGVLARAEAPLERVPLYVRGGSVVPMGPAMQHTDERPADPITLRIYPDAAGRAQGELYEDDGETLACQRGEFRRTRFELAGPVLHILPRGTFQPGARSWEIRMPWTGKNPRVRVDGKPVTRMAVQAGELVMRLEDTGEEMRVEIR